MASDEQRAQSWIETELGGRVVGAERQPRWRPAWFFDLERGSERLPLYFRGERGEADHGVYTLEHEMRVLQVLEGQGIPVPHVYGFCPDPRGIVMERSAGRANLASAESEAERSAVLDHYMEILARMHALDPALFEAIGIRRPVGAEAIGLCDHEIWERAYRRDKRRPEPAIEFLIRWVRGQVPRDRERVSFICCDAGQFMFESGRVTAVIDLELACLGDPAADLGGMRGRDLSEPLGDLARGVRRYEELTGEPVDRRAIDFHTVRFGLVTPMAVARLVAEPPEGLDFVQYLSWYVVWTRTCLEVVADRHDLSLGTLELPAELTRTGDATDAGASFEAYEQDTAARIATWRERQERFGPDLEAQDLDDASALLGRRVTERAAADVALEAHILEAPEARALDALPYLHRRLCRQEAILRPVLRELADARIQRV